MATSVSFNLHAGRMRQRLRLAVLVILVAGAWRALPLEQLAYVLLLLRHLPVTGGERPSAVAFSRGQWWQVWMTQAALCVFARPHVWVFRDELNPRDWAALRRYLRLHTPRTPWGLSISR